MPCLLLSAAAAAAPWQHIGPHNIGDDVTGQGFAGTLSDAVSPLSNPNLIYTGGHNNGASSGVLKSTNRGKTWIPYSNGHAAAQLRALLAPAPVRHDRGCSPRPSGCGTRPSAA